MRSRQLNKRIEIYQTVNVSDGFGGNTVYDELITSSWAKIETYDDKKQRQSDIGVADHSQQLKMVIRYRNDIAYNSINQFIMYRGVRYDFTISPNDMDFSNTFISLIAVREVIEDAGTLQPINADSNVILVNYKNRVEGNGGELSSEQCTETYIESLL
jgi:SPP1 family predicted phage head-tail adaptor